VIDAPSRRPGRHRHHPFEEGLIMLRTLFPGALAAALLLAGGQASSHAPGFDESARALPRAALLLAQADMKHGMAGHGDMPTFTVGDLVIESPWARESVTPSSAAYLTVRNSGDQDDRLIGVTSAVANRTELHSSTMEGGVMKMQPVEAVLVPAHGEAALAPGGLHVMLMGLNGRLEEGKSFALTLEFEHAGKIEVMATIEDIAYGGDHSH
jgi:periplasmic copper chaperone A